MLTIKVNDKFDFEIDPASGIPLNSDMQTPPEISESSTNHFQIIHQNTVYTAELIDLDRSEKKCTIRVNAGIYTVSVKDQFDKLLEQLGMSGLNSKAHSELKAPMPGMVLKVLVNEGDTVAKGDSLLILEAMKMENIIKAPADATIGSIRIKATDKVEKNQVLINFG